MNSLRIFKCKGSQGARSRARDEEQGGGVSVNLSELSATELKELFTADAIMLGLDPPCPAADNTPWTHAPFGGALVEKPLIALAEKSLFAAQAELLHGGIVKRKPGSKRGLPAGVHAAKHAPAVEPDLAAERQNQRPRLAHGGRSDAAHAFLSRRGTKADVVVEPSCQGEIALLAAHDNAQASFRLHPLAAYHPGGLGDGAAASCAPGGSHVDSPLLNSRCYALDLAFAPASAPGYTTLTTAKVGAAECASAFQLNAIAAASGQPPAAHYLGFYPVPSVPIAHSALVWMGSPSAASWGYVPPAYQPFAVTKVVQPSPLRRAASAPPTTAEDMCHAQAMQSMEHPHLPRPSPVETAQLVGLWMEHKDLLSTLTSQRRQQQGDRDSSRHSCQGCGRSKAGHRRSEVHTKCVDAICWCGIKRMLHPVTLSAGARCLGEWHNLVKTKPFPLDATQPQEVDAAAPGLEAPADTAEPLAAGAVAGA
jgi:hypothetical protein